MDERWFGKDACTPGDVLDGEQTLTFAGSFTKLEQLLV